ncbi:unnamed protein product [Arctia plantaginis]|uniref:Uncharacterized protein n=1 Tax=Arctia plantaginis TaxID=874455 RepID=A0A8S0Z8Q2_ARCPL|nr:unnamed protein product [Arctia plantaginis]
MEDEKETKEEDQPSTSKKASPDENMIDNTRRDETETNSETSVTGSYFARSRVDMADIRSDAPKVPIVTKREREPKSQIRKKRKIMRRAGRVEKRHRSYSRREMKRFSRRKPRVRQEIKEDPSVTTIYTRLSSRSVSRVQLCSHCGHRCCRRR